MVFKRLSLVRLSQRINVTPALYFLKQKCMFVPGELCDGTTETFRAVIKISNDKLSWTPIA